LRALALLAVIVIAASAAAGPSVDEKVTKAYGYERFAKLHGCTYDTDQLDSLGETIGACDGGYGFVIDSDGTV